MFTISSSIILVFAFLQFSFFYSFLFVYMFWNTVGLEEGIRMCEQKLNYWSQMHFTITPKMIYIQFIRLWIVENVHLRKSKLASYIRNLNYYFNYYEGDIHNVNILCFTSGAWGFLKDPVFSICHKNMRKLPPF